MNGIERPIGLLLVTASFLVVARGASATEWYVAQGASGNGTATSPFGSVQEALNAARGGDRITVRPGTYSGSLSTVRGGTSTAPIVLGSEQGRSTSTVTASGVVLRVTHPYIVVEGLVFDGQYGSGRPLDIGSGATGFTLRDSEVRRTSRNCIDIDNTAQVTIENALIHHCLNPANGGTDAHGIVAGAVHDLIIRDTEIHTFSGDAFQVDPDRAAPGWNGVTIERSKFWLEPLPRAENGFAAGTVPGENAIDTKTAASAPRAALVVRDVEAYGFRNGRITNQAAFVIKENVDATLDRVTVRDSEVAFRMRGPSGDLGAIATISNAVVSDVDVAVRYENNIQQLRIYNATFGLDVGRAFKAASSNASGLDVRNLLLVGSTLPAEASGPTNLAVDTGVFVDAAGGDYHLFSGSRPIDAGVAISGVTADRDGVARPQGKAVDIGAYEWLAGGGPGPTPSGEVVLHVAQTPLLAGGWRIVADTSAAGGKRLTHPDAGADKVSSPLAAPIHYFEVTFIAEANVDYHVWVRGRADQDSLKNDTAFVQFDNSINGKGSPVWRIGSTGAAKYVLMDCSGCSVSGWGWQDLGSVGTLGPVVRFAKAGQQRIRVQTSEDGLSIDQILLSPATWLNAPPGPATDDATILPATP